MAGAKIPQDWDNETWICWSVQWPNSRDWLSILQGFLSTSQRGRYWDETTGSLLGVQQVGVEIANRNEFLEECLMACNETTNGILEAMLAALQTIANNQCCQSGSGGAGPNPAPDSPVTSTPEDREGPPPNGHTSWSAYDTYKCDAANLIFDNLLADVAATSAITVGILGVSELAFILVPLLITPAAWVTLLAIAALMIQMAILTIAYAEVIEFLEDNRDELICAMLDGNTVADSISSFTVKVTDLLPSEPEFSDPVTSYVATNFINSFASVDSFNRLYTKVGGVPTGSTCDCGGACSLVFTSVFTEANGTMVSGSMDSGSVTIASVQVQWDGNPGDLRHAISFIGSECCWQLLSFSTDAPDIQHWGAGVDAGCGSDIGFFTDGPPPLEQCINQMGFLPHPSAFNDPFEITITWEACSP